MDHQDHFAHGRRVGVRDHVRLGRDDGRAGSFRDQEPPSQPVLPQDGHLGGRSGARRPHQVRLQLLGLPRAPLQV